LLKRFMVFVLVLMLLFTSAMLITGCETKEVEEVVEEEEEKEMILATASEVESLCPITPPSARLGTAVLVMSHTLESLFMVNPDNFMPEPLLAESAEASPDGMAWTIKLREGISFHDGAPFNAEAAKLNLDRWRLGEAVVSGMLNDFVDEVEVLGDYTIKLHMKVPFGPMLNNLSNPQFGMVSPALFEDLPEGETYEIPIGTGPYQVAQWDRGAQIILEKVEDYWGEPAKIDRLIIKFAPEAAARVIMLEAGDVDYTAGIPVPEINRLKQNPAIDVREVPAGRVIFLGLNMSKPHFQDERVRHALNYAIDKAAWLLPPAFRRISSGIKIWVRTSITRRKRDSSWKKPDMAMA